MSTCGFSDNAKISRKITELVSGGNFEGLLSGVHKIQTDYVQFVTLLL